MWRFLYTARNSGEANIITRLLYMLWFESVSEYDWGRNWEGEVEDRGEVPLINLQQFACVWQINLSRTLPDRPTTRPRPELMIDTSHLVATGPHNLRKSGLIRPEPSYSRSRSVHSTARYLLPPEQTRLQLFNVLYLWVFCWLVTRSSPS